MPVNGNVQVRRSVLPEGVAGVDATVRKMVEMAHSQWGSKSAKIRALAIDIVKRAGVPDKQYFLEMVAIHNWVRDNIRYFRDPIGQETLSYPEETAFNSKGGDCDDLSILEIALLGAIGLEAYPVVIGMFPNHYSHVYVHGKVPAGPRAGEIIPLDPIMKNWPAGREAKNVKAKKTYPQLSNPLTINGNDNMSDDLGAYAVGPSYLDMEDSHAGQISIPDRKASYTHQDNTVANSTRVNMPFSGLDGMLSGGFSEDSAGRAGTIVESGGQMVPKGFLRNEPDIQEMMHTDPATGRDLGPRGPIFAASARRRTSMIREGNTPVNAVPSLTQPARVQAVPQTVGQKRYELPSIAQAFRRQKGLTANPVAPLPKQKIVALNSVALDRLGAPAQPLPTLGEALAGAERELAGLGAFMANFKRPNITVHDRENEAKTKAQVQARILELERKILALRQKLRALGGGKIIRPGLNIRAAAIQKSEAAAVAQAMPVTQPVEGMGGFLDTIKKPIVWAPILAFAAVIGLRFYLKRRKA
jgi:hypothetical protein